MVTTKNSCIRIMLPLAAMLLTLGGSVWAEEKKPNIFVI